MKKKLFPFSFRPFVAVMHGDVNLGDFPRFIFGLAVSSSIIHYSNIQMHVQSEDEF